MSTHTNHQIVTHKGAPVAVVIPYEEYLGLTQGDVAKAMNVSQPVSARMESGKLTPRLSTLRRISKALGIEAAQLDVRP